MLNSKRRHWSSILQATLSLIAIVILGVIRTEAYNSDPLSSFAIGERYDAWGTKAVFLDRNLLIGFLNEYSN